MWHTAWERCQCGQWACAGGFRVHLGTAPESRGRGLGPFNTSFIHPRKVWRRFPPRAAERLSVSGAEPWPQVHGC